MTQLKVNSAEYNAGYAAGKAKQSEATCPSSYSAKARSQWVSGWHSGGIAAYGKRPGGHISAGVLVSITDAEGVLLEQFPVYTWVDGVTQPDFANRVAGRVLNHRATLAGE